MGTDFFQTVGFGNGNVMFNTVQGVVFARFWPTLRVLLDQITQKLDVIRSVVQTRYVLVTLAAVAFEIQAILLVNFLNSFQAIGGKSRAQDINGLNPFAG